MGKLYIVPTPIGNLEDITLRALRVLREVDLIATEDTRTTGRLLKHFEIECPMLSYHEHNEEARLERILQSLAQGDVALVSEAGTPIFSDPGYKLVRTAIDQDFEVSALPGPSALLAALPASGLPLDRFSFYGFLPRKAGARRQLLAEVASQQNTLVFFETPHRLQSSLTDMVDILGEMRSIAICRELTKLYEEIWRGTLIEACQVWHERNPRGEFTLVVAGASVATVMWDQAQVEVAVTEALAAGNSCKGIAQEVAAQSGWSKKEVYTLALQVKNYDSLKK
jgi:16S rRNA (cytidine1402-2'-O)-methyltransferase